MRAVLERLELRAHVETYALGDGTYLAIVRGSAARTKPKAFGWTPEEAMDEAMKIERGEA